MSVFDGLASVQRIGQAEKDLEMAGTGLSQEEKRVRLDVRKAVDAAVKAGRRREGEAGSARLRGGAAEERPVVLRQRRGQPRGPARAPTSMAGSAELDLLLARFTREEALADIAHLTGERL